MGGGFRLGWTFSTLDDAHRVGSCYYLRIKKNVGIADQQKKENEVGMIAWNTSVHNSTLHTAVVYVTFFSSRCMLELKIFHRTASLSSWASSEMYAVLAEESLTRLCSSIESTMDAKDSSCLHAHNHYSNSVILNKNCLIAKWLICVHVYKFGFVG